MIWLKLIWYILKYCGLVMLICAFYMFTLNFLGYPLNTVNIPIVVILWLMIFSADLRYLWLVIPVGFVLETWSVGSFGLMTLSLIISLAIVSWIFFRVFTNRSVYIIVLETILAVVIFRIVFCIFLIIISDLSWSMAMADAALWWAVGYEILTTTSLLLLAYLSTTFLVRYFRPEYIKLNTKGNYV